MALYLKSAREGSLYSELPTISNDRLYTYALETYTSNDLITTDLVLTMLKEREVQNEQVLNLTFHNALSLNNFFLANETLRALATLPSAAHSYPIYRQIFANALFNNDEAASLLLSLSASISSSRFIDHSPKSLTSVNLHHFNNLPDCVARQRSLLYSEAAYHQTVPQSLNSLRFPVTTLNFVTVASQHRHNLHRLSILSNVSSSLPGLSHKLHDDGDGITFIQLLQSAYSAIMIAKEYQIVLPLRNETFDAIANYLVEKYDSVSVPQIDFSSMTLEEAISRHLSSFTSVAPVSREKLLKRISSDLKAFPVADNIPIVNRSRLQSFEMVGMFGWDPVSMTTSHQTLNAIEDYFLSILLLSTARRRGFSFESIFSRSFLSALLSLMTRTASFYNGIMYHPSSSSSAINLPSMNNVKAHLVVSQFPTVASVAMIQSSPRSLLRFEPLLRTSEQILPISSVSWDFTQTRTQLNYRIRERVVGEIDTLLEETASAMKELEEKDYEGHLMIATVFYSNLVSLSPFHAFNEQLASLLSSFMLLSITLPIQTYSSDPATFLKNHNQLQHPSQLSWKTAQALSEGTWPDEVGSKQIFLKPKTPAKRTLGCPRSYLGIANKMEDELCNILEKMENVMHMNYETEG
ncbi:hypothetical protein BLNAU_9048 [Blattamonas nauphoetae]|uniref:Uncharacterized protein n=1 Tax=Blattamonas nauphoetae TaxID=2049346 RepID=A0ABQ9XX54_9EUKA|nr:hypothetical protein BLNAU_9048 [Blattamonas nauphoetae]